MLLYNIVHKVNKISIFDESLAQERNETRKKMNFYITRNKHRRFEDADKNQDISMLVLLRRMIKKANKTAEVALI